MVCGRLAMRIAWVIFLNEARTREIPFTFPKPLVHLQCHLVNIVLEGSTKGGGGVYAYIDLRSVFRSSPSDFIPNRSNTTAAMIVVEQKKLQAIHLFLLTLVHHLCAPFCFHCLGPVFHPCLHSRSMNCRSAKHIPIVVGSGTLKKESTASPKVTRVGSRDLKIVIIIPQALTRLQQITTIIMSRENCTLHFSLVISLLHPAISTSPTVLSFTHHGSPLVKFVAGSLGSQQSGDCGSKS